MEMDRPPACYFASVQDGKQEIYLEWPKQTPSPIKWTKHLSGSEHAPDPSLFGEPGGSGHFPENV